MLVRCRRVLRRRLAETGLIFLVIIVGLWMAEIPSENAACLDDTKGFKWQ